MSQTVDGVVKIMHGRMPYGSRKVAEAVYEDKFDVAHFLNDRDELAMLVFALMDQANYDPACSKAVMDTIREGK